MMFEPKVTIITPRRRQRPPPGGILRRQFRVGRFTVTIAMDTAMIAPGVRGQTNIEWQPDLPAPGELSPRELRQYIDGRNAIYQEIADIAGGGIAVADV